MKKINICIILVFMLGWVSPVSAQLMIEEGKVALDVAPGETIVDSITVHNTSDKEVDVKVYWEDFMYVKPFDGAKKFSPAGSLLTSSSNWIRFGPTEFTLAPFTKKKVNYTIKAPEFFKGGYYGVLFAEQMLEDVSLQTGMRVISRVGCLFFIEDIDKNKDAEIKGITIADGKIKGAFINQGNVIQIPKGVYYLLDQDGRAVSRGQIAEVYLPPQERAGFDIALPKDLDNGQFTLVLTFDQGEGDSVVKEIDIEKVKNGIVELRSIRD